VRQDFGRATPRSTGARAADSARLTLCLVGVRSRAGGGLRGVVTHRGGSHVGAVGKDGNVLAFADPDDPVGAGRSEIVRGRTVSARSTATAHRVRHHLHVHPVGSADGDAEPGSKLGEGVGRRRYGRPTRARCCGGRELAAAVTRAGDDEHGYPLDQGVGARGLRPRTPPPTARKPRALRTSTPSPNH
jgi:hypothetical protein